MMFAIYILSEFDGVIKYKNNNILIIILLIIIKKS